MTTNIVEVQLRRPCKLKINQARNIPIFIPHIGKAVAVVSVASTG